MRYYRINAPKALGQIIDGEAVIVNLESGNYYSLNASGTLIWDLIASAVDPVRMRAVLSRKYRGDEEEIAKALHGFLAQLAQEDLIVETDAAQAGEPAMPPTTSDEAAPGRPAFLPPTLDKYSDMQDLIALDPIHEVDDTGWPTKKAEATEAKSLPSAERQEKDVK